jgi:hypothetical protein
MKFYWTIPKGLKQHYLQELQHYKNAFEQNDLQNAWYYLERAHILGQAYPKEHSYVHWKMLQFGFAIKSWIEIKGQILRLIFGGVKSFVGKVPVGNTGGSNVPPLMPMEIAPDLKDILKAYDSI